MAKARCIKARIGEISFDAYWDKAFVRMKADGKAFFSCWPFHVKTDFLETLPVGTEVSMGAYPFPDGTYGMHWLHAPGYGTAEDRRWCLRLMIPLVCSLAACAVIFFCLSLMDASWAYGVYPILGLVFVFHPILHAAILALDGDTRKLRRDLRQVKKGFAADYVPYDSLMEQYAGSGATGEEAREKYPPASCPGGIPPGSPDVRTAPASEALENRYSTATGQAENIKAYLYSGGRKFYYEYAFTCDGRDLSLVFQNTTLEADYVREGYHKNHAFMLAEGDRVRAIVREDGKGVQALRNDTDGCAYWICGYAGKAKLKKTALVILLCFVGIVVSFVCVDYAENGGIDWSFVKLTTGYMVCGAGLVLLCLAGKGGAAQIGPGD